MSAPLGDKPLRVSMPQMIEMLTRRAWEELCGLSMVDPRRAPHPWREVGSSGDRIRVEIREAQASQFLMLCGITLKSAKVCDEVREAKAIVSLIGKVCARYPGVKAMTIDAWKAAYGRHRLPPLDEVSMTDPDWQHVHNAWMHAR